MRSLLWLVVVVMGLQVCQANEQFQNYDDFFLIPSCIEPGYEEPCSGHGACIDGVCLCDSLEDSDLLYRYSGRYCEECPYCNGQRCQKIFKCLKCRSSSNCGGSCDLTYIPSVDVKRNASADEKACFVEDENGCFINFKYFYDDQELVVFANDEKDCYDGYKIVLYVCAAVFVYIMSLFGLIHCLCDRCPQRAKLPRRKRNVDIVRIPTSLTDD